MDSFYIPMQPAAAPGSLLKDMELVRWLEKKLGDNTESWAGRNAASFLSKEMLEELETCFQALEPQAKLKIIMAIPHVQPRYMSSWRVPIQALINLARRDADDWVETIAEMYRDLPTTGMIIPNTTSKTSYFYKTLEELRERVHHHEKEGNLRLLPIGCQIVAQNVIKQKYGVGEVEVEKHFNICRRPKSSLLFTETLKAAEALKNPVKAKNGIVSSLPIKVRSTARLPNNELPMKGIPTVNTCKLSAGFTNEPKKFQRQLSKREGGAKLLDIGEIPQSLKKRRMIQENEEKKKKEKEKEDMRKKAMEEKEARLAQIAKQKEEARLIAEQKKTERLEHLKNEQSVGKSVRRNTTDVSEKIKSPPRSTIQLQSPPHNCHPAVVAEPIDPELGYHPPMKSSTTLSQTTKSSSIFSPPSSPMASRTNCSTLTHMKSPQNIASAAQQQVSNRPVLQVRPLLTDQQQPSSQNMQCQLMQQKTLTMQQGAQQLQQQHQRQERNLLSSLGSTSEMPQRIAVRMTSKQVMQVRRMSQQQIQISQNQEYMQHTQEMQHNQPQQQGSMHQYGTQAPQQHHSMQSNIQHDQYFQQQQVQTQLQHRQNGHNPPQMNQLQHQQMQLQMKRQGEHPTPSYLNVQLAPTMEQSQEEAEKAREAIRRQCEDMLRTANKLDQNGQKMVFSFMTGNKNNPRPELGHIITLKLSESLEDGVVDGQICKMRIETFFQMDYATGEWKRLRKCKLVRDDDLPDNFQDPFHVEVNIPPPHMQQHLCAMAYDPNQHENY